MNRYQYKDLIIEVFDDPIYSFNSTDNKVNYSKCYFGKDAREYHTSKHGIIIRRGNQEISSCLVVGSGGATGIYQRSTLVDKDELLICCCDTIFCLTIPNLDLKWNVQADKVTCFELYKLQNDYIIYGECQITRITCDGQINGNLMAMIFSCHCMMIKYLNLKKTTSNLPTLVEQNTI